MPAPPLAGKPPFATDEPDSVYDAPASPTKRRAPPPKPDNPNARSSAYDVYDNYLSPDAANRNGSSSHLRNNSAVSSASRNSGIGALGMGLLAMDSDDDDDSDDDEAFERRRKAEREQAAKAKEAASAPLSSSPNSKNAALAAAIANGNNTNKPSSPSPPPSPPPQSPPPIAAPKPGYAGPTIATLGVKTPSPGIQNPFEPPQPQGHPVGGPIHPPLPPHLRNPPGLGGPQNPVRGPPPPQQFRPMGAPPGLSINMSLMNNAPISPPPGAMMRGMTPAPLAPPLTPIKPVFAVPKSGASDSGHGDDKEGAGIKWDDLPAPTPRKPIMRSNTEDALLPRRGEKGDDFWRRFSMIAKTDTDKKPSPWLRKTVGGSNRLSRWVWVVGMLILGVIGAAIGLGLYFTKDNPDHQQPSVLAGGEGTQKADTTTPTPEVATGAGGTSTRSILHVTPTLTIRDRALFTAVAPPGRREEEEMVLSTTTTPCTTALESMRTHSAKFAEGHGRHMNMQKKRRF